MIRELATIAENLKTGRAVDPVTVRTFLGWFGAKRRGFGVIHGIRWRLEEAGLVTVPDFQSSWIDSHIEFRLMTAEQEEAPLTGEAAQIEDESIESDPTTVSAEPVIIWVSKDPSTAFPRFESYQAALSSL